MTPPDVVRVRRDTLGGYVIRVSRYSRFWDAWVMRFSVTADSLAEAVASFRDVGRMRELATKRAT